MPKNLVVCCDGTANEFARDHTNVLKLFSALVQEPGAQLAIYHPGVGTMEAVGALTSTAREVTKLLGKAIGYGLETDIRDAYASVMEFHEEGDRLFLFGFSRGAYTVRAVASLLHMFGLMRRGQERLIPYAIRMMSALDREDAGFPDGSRSAARRAFFEQAERFKATFSDRVCRPHFVGVWDTVSSVGWIENPLKLPWTANNPSIRIGRHAVSLDERRAFFRTNLWVPAEPPKRSGPADLMQVWFPGAHGDVGGGYPEEESGLSKFALGWMACEARKAGLLVDRGRFDLVMGRAGDGYAPADPDACLHESLRGWWRLAEFVPRKRGDRRAGRGGRRMNLFRRRDPPPAPLVHDVAFLRRGYRPPPGAVRVRTDPIR
ncbi:DUF2235 domain-containing protein [Craurococcus roseus]|uniref:DUF2235 domain-containing protein n=1 Tax=Craurococcus roseus TaxID=77585 RepID=A0ABN1FNQ7_9PROT